MNFRENLCWAFLLKIWSAKFKFGYNRTKLTGILHKDLGAIMANWAIKATKVIFVKTVSNVFMVVIVTSVTMVSMLLTLPLIFWFPCLLSSQRLQMLLL